MSSNLSCEVPNVILTTTFSSEMIRPYPKAAPTLATSERDRKAANALEGEESQEEKMKRQTFE